MTTLVTGATGNVGRLVVDQLLAAGAKDIRALTNNPKKAALPAGIEVVEDYLGRIKTLPAALEGVERMYLAPLPRTVRDVVALAERAGVRRIVDLSSFDADADAATAMIDLEDIAAVAARVLLEDGHLGKKYLMTGPEAVKRSDLARLIGEVIGRNVDFEEQTHEEALVELSAGLGEYAAAWYLDGMHQLVDHPQTPLPTVEEITGRPATTFAVWAAKHSDKFR